MPKVGVSRGMGVATDAEPPVLALNGWVAPFIELEEDESGGGDDLIVPVTQLLLAHAAGGGATPNTSAASAGAGTTATARTAVAVATGAAGITAATANPPRKVQVLEAPKVSSGVIVDNNIHSINSKDTGQHDSNHITTTDALEYVCLGYKIMLLVVDRSVGVYAWLYINYLDILKHPHGYNNYIQTNWRRVFLLTRALRTL